MKAWRNGLGNGPQWGVLTRSLTWCAAGASLALFLPVGARGQTTPMAMDDRATYAYWSVDELEYLIGPEDRPIELDALGWIGGDFNRGWVKVHGERSTRERAAGFEGQLLYGKVIAPFWDAQVGFRIDAHREDGRSRARGLVAFGVQGLAPYWFEVESAFFVSQKGHLSARLQASYDLLFTQRLILEPEVQLDLALQEVPDFDVARGINSLEVGARLRYEIIREIAPYIGVSWVRAGNPIGGTSGAAGARWETSILAGLRWWY